MTLRTFLTRFRRDQLVEIICLIADKIPFVGRMLQEWAKASIEEVEK